jgi:hypothetical protein
MKPPVKRSVRSGARVRNGPTIVSPIGWVVGYTGGLLRVRWVQIFEKTRRYLDSGDDVITCRQMVVGRLVYTVSVAHIIVEARVARRDQFHILQIILLERTVNLLFTISPQQHVILTGSLLMNLMDPTAIQVFR